MLARLAERKKLIDTGLTPDEATKISTEADTDITEGVLAQYLTEDDEIILQNLKSEESDAQKQKDKVLKKAELEAQKLIRREKLDSIEGKIRNTYNIFLIMSFFWFFILTLRRPLRRKLRIRWFFDVPKVKESSFFFKSDLT